MRTFVAVMLCLVVAGTVNAGSSTPEYPDLHALYTRYAKAMLDHDTELYATFFTDDFSLVTSDGRVYGGPQSASCKQSDANSAVGGSTFSITVESIDTMDNGEIAVVVLEQNEREEALPEQPKQLQTITISVIQREIWRNTPEGWKIRKVEQILGPFLLNEESSSHWL